MVRSAMTEYHIPRDDAERAICRALIVAELKGWRHAFADVAVRDEVRPGVWAIAVYGPIGNGPVNLRSLDALSTAAVHGTAYVTDQGVVEWEIPGGQEHCRFGQSNVAAEVPVVRWP